MTVAEAAGVAGPAEETAEARAAGWFAQLRLLLVRNLREGARNPVLAYLLPVVIPLGLLILVATTLKRVTDLPGFPNKNYAEWMMPGIVMMAGMTGVGYSATSLMLDLQTGFLDRLRLLEARPLALLVSRALFDIVRVVPAGIALLLIGFAFHSHVEQGPLGVLGLLALLVLWAAAYGGLYFVIALFTGNPQAPLALAPLFMPLSFLSSLYIPTSLLPGWVRATAVWNPFKYMVDAGRALTTGPYSGEAILKAVAVASAMLVVTMGASLWAFRRALDPG